MVEIYGYLVAVLSVLTSVLIGWQIYTVINFDRQKEKIIENIDRELIQLRTHIYDELGMVNMKLIEFFSEKKEGYHLLSMCIEVIRYIPDDRKVVQGCITRMLNHLEENGAQFSEPYQKKRILQDMRDFVSINPYVDKQELQRLMQLLQ